VGKNRGKKDRKFKRFKRFRSFKRFERFKVQEVLPKNAGQEVQSFKNPPFFQGVAFKNPA
jgi:hypothetical protein